MATSGSFNYTVTRDDIIAEALRICQVIGMGETPETQAVTDAAVPLNMMLKAWVTDGMPLWDIKTEHFTLTASTASYTVGTGATWDTPAPTRILQAWRRDSSQSPATDTPIEVITREEYFRLNPKLTTGTPTQLYYDPGSAISGTYAQGTAYVWPAPTSTAATNYTIGFNYVRPYQDFDASTDQLGMPQEWQLAVAWGLASILCYHYGLPFAERSMIKKNADSYKAFALQGGSQEGSMYIQPDRRW